MNGKTKAIIILSVVCVILSGIIVFGIFYQRNTDRKYQQEIIERDDIILGIRQEIDGIDGANTELEGSKRDTDASLQDIDGTITESRESVIILQDVRNTIEGENSTIRKEVEEIRQILKEVMAGNN